MNKRDKVEELIEQQLKETITNVSVEYIIKSKKYGIIK